MLVVPEAAIKFQIYNEESLLFRIEACVLNRKQFNLVNISAPSHSSVYDLC